MRAPAWASSAPPAPPAPLVPSTAAPGSSAPERRIPAAAVWWALLGLVAGEVIGGVLAQLGVAVTGSDTSALTTLLGEVGLWAGMLAAVVVVSRERGTGSLRRDYGLAVRPVDLGWGVVVAVAGLVLSGVLGSLFAGSRLAGSNTQLITGQRHNGAGTAVVTLIVSLGAPFVEELFFRGLVRTALATRFRPGWAVVLQGGLFGLAHANPATGLGNVEVVVVIGAFGVVLGLVATRLGRLGAGMVGHGLFNLVVAASVLTR